MQRGIITDFINLVEDISYLLFYIRENRLEYYSRTINRDAYTIVKVAHL